MADKNIAARFARTIRNLLVPPPVVPSFDENVDPEIARIEWAIARLPKRTRDVFLMHRLDDLRYDRIKPASRTWHPHCMRLVQSCGRT